MYIISGIAVIISSSLLIALGCYLIFSNTKSAEMRHKNDDYMWNDYDYSFSISVSNGIRTKKTLSRGFKKDLF